MPDLGVKVRGIAAQDARVSRANLADVGAGTTDSSYTRASPRPGSAVSSDNLTQAVPVVSAAQTNDLDFLAAVGGSAEVNGASLAYKRDSEAATAWRGWNPQNWVYSMRNVRFTPASTEIWTQLDAVVVPGNQKVIVVAHDTDATVREDSVSRTWDPTTGTFGGSVTAIESGAVDGGVYSHICATIIPGTSRAVVFVLTPSATSPTARAYYSDDDGDSWSAYARDWAPASAAASDRMRCAWDGNGNLMILLEDTSTGDWWQWVSDDRGQTFTEHDSNTALGYSFELAEMPDGRIMCVYAAFADGHAQSIVLADAYDEPDATPVEIVATNMDYVAVTVDYDGQALVYCRPDAAAGNAERLAMFRTADNGANWTQFPSPIDGQGSANDMDLHKAVSTCGMTMLFVTGSSAMTAASKRSLYAIFLGGWSNIEVDGNTTFRQAPSRPSFGKHTSVTARDGIFLNVIENPAQQGWTTTGAGTQTTGQDGLVFASSGNTIYSEETFTHAARVVCDWEYSVTSGGTQTDTTAGFTIRRADGANEYIVEIQCDTSGFRVYDAGGVPASLGAVAIDNSSKISMRASFTDINHVVIWYKRVSAVKWTEGPSGTLSTLGAGATTDRFQGGCITSGTAQITWGPMGWSPGSRVLYSLTAGTDKWEPLEWGKPVNVYGYPLIDEGDSDRRSRVRWLGSPVRYGQTWDVDAIAEYDADRMLPTIAPSPSDPWRSTQTASDEYFVFDLEGAGQDTWLDGGRFLAVGFFGINFRTAYVEIRKSSGVGGWVTAGTLDAATGFTSLRYVQSLAADTIIRPDSSTPTATAGRYLQAGEKAAGHIIFDPSGTPEAIEIGAHLGGWWKDHTTQGAEPFVRMLSPPSATSGLMHMVSPNAVILIPVDTFSAQFRYLRIRIPGGQTVPDSYYQIGSLFVGAVVPFGKQWSRGWSWRRDSNVRRERSSYGTEYVQQLGPNARELRVSWADGVDSLLYRGDSTVPWVGSATVPGVARDDVLHQLWSLQDLALGGELPCLAVMDVPTSATTLTDPTLFLYGSLSGRIQANHVLGNEGIGEVWRIEGLNIRELV